MKIIESTIETRQIFKSEAYKYAMADGEEESPFVFIARKDAEYDKYVRGSLVYKDDDRAYADFKNKETIREATYKEEMAYLYLKIYTKCKSRSGGGCFRGCIFYNHCPLLPGNTDEANEILKNKVVVE